MTINFDRNKDGSVTVSDDDSSMVLVVGNEGRIEIKSQRSGGSSPPRNAPIAPSSLLSPVPIGGITTYGQVKRPLPTYGVTVGNFVLKDEDDLSQMIASATPDQLRRWSCGDYYYSSLPLTVSLARWPYLAEALSNLKFNDIVNGLDIDFIA